MVERICVLLRTPWQQLKEATSTVFVYKTSLAAARHISHHMPKNNISHTLSTHINNSTALEPLNSHILQHLFLEKIIFSSFIQDCLFFEK